MPLPIPVVLALSTACAPAAAPETLVSVVRVESGFDPLVIGVNGRRPAQIHPTSKAEAVATAERLMAQGANFDLGLGQINVRNLTPLGLSIEDAFDPCRNLAAAAQVLAADYGLASPRPGTEQAALRTSLSLYNTGDAARGFRNGYVARVTAAAAQIVPALQLDAAKPAAAPLPPPPPPTWDVFASGPPPTAGFVFSPATPGGHP